VLSGIFLAVDNLAPSKQSGSPGTPKPAEAFSFRGILKSVSPMLRERCAKSARAALTQRGIDPADDDVGPKIDSYCTCAVDRSLDEMSIGEFLAFRLNPSSEPAASKMKTIMQQCQEGIGR